MHVIRASKQREVTGNREYLSDSLSRNVSSPWITSGVLAAVDLVALSLSWVLAIWGRIATGADQLQANYYGSLSPLLVLFPLVYAVVGLYPATGISAPDRLRRLSYGTSAVYVVLAVFAFLTKSGETYSRGVFLIAWFFSLFFIPLARSIVHSIFEKRAWWGNPVVVLGGGKTGAAVVHALRNNPSLGLKPVAILDDDQTTHGSYIGNVLVAGGLALAEDIAEAGVRHAIVAIPGVPLKRLLELMEAHGWPFPHVIVVPDLFGLSSLWVSARDLGGILGLEIHEQLLLRGPRLVKRALDLLLVVMAIPLLVPLIAVIAVAIKLDSPGPIFYGHRRVGFGGFDFVAWKFRSMRTDADKALMTYLDQHPELRAEWEKDRKLRVDPRVTTVGRFLRKTSLDELPQLWNVIVGEMSLVGPRPIVAEETARYGQAFVLYTKVKPGITGLWQISGRSDTSYASRVVLDSYYARNWSVWLDLYILAQTVKTVLSGKGAY